MPNGNRMQDVLFMECLHLAGLSQKQGFMAGFTFALEVMRIGSNEVTNTTAVTVNGSSMLQTGL